MAEYEENFIEHDTNNDGYTASVDNVLFSSQDGGEIVDGSGDDFIALEAGANYKIEPYSTDEASITLTKCKKYIVFPYNLLLKVVGWRAIYSRSDSCHHFLKVFNIVYPVFIFVMIIFACIAQVTSCFHRSRSMIPQKINEYYVISCENHLVTYDILSYLMMLFAYPLALYTFRVAEPENLSSLAESVFLSFNDVIRSKSRKRPFFVLLIIFFAGILFFFVSAVISIVRLIALQLHEKDTIIGWFTNNTTAENQSDYLRVDRTTYNVLHYFLVIIAYFGFLFFDMLFIAVTINYCSQCQLLTYYIDNIQDKVRNKKYGSLNIAIKEIHRVYDFLKILNGNLAIVASLIFFIFVSNLIISYNDFIDPDQRPLNAVTGFLNTMQWLVAVIFPVLLAARLTSSGNELRRLGQEIAARPFYYSDTPDLELQFFLNFTESTRYQVNLAFIPMQPSLVLGFGFIVLLFISSGIVISQVESAMWF